MNALKIKQPFFFLFCLFLAVESLFAQSKVALIERNFTQFESSDGYPQGIVTDIHQDKLGFIWIATADGLFRFDGYNFKEYRTSIEDKNTIPSNTVTQVLSDQADNIWISTEGNGLSQLNRKTGQFKHYYASKNNPGTIPDNNIWSLCLDQNGSIWAGSRSNGLFSLNPQTDSIRHFLTLIDDQNSLWSNHITAICQLSSGMLWVGTVKGINLVHPKTGEVKRLPASKSLSNPNIQAIYEQENGQIWVGTQNGLNQWDASSNTFKRVGGSGANRLSQQNIKSIATGPNQKLWVGIDKGLNTIDLQTGEIEHIRFKSESNIDLPLDRVEALLLDQQNLLWIGTWGGPLKRVDSVKEPFKYWGADQGNSKSLSSGNIKAIVQTEEEVLWIGTRYDGVNRIDRKTGALKIINTQNGLSHNSVFSIYADSKGAWIGTSSGLNYYDEATGKVYQYNSENSPLPNSLIWAIKKDKKGHLWIGTDDGLAVLKAYQAGDPLVLDLFFNDPESLNSLSSSSIRSLFVDQDNNVWIGTSKDGLNYYNRQKATFTPYTYAPDKPNGIPEDYIFFINEDHEGHIWVGTAKGASRLDRETGQFTHLTEKDGLPNNYVFSIFEDKDYNLWMSTNRGLFRFEPTTGAFQVFSELDGLQDNEFNQGAAFQDLATGTLFFGGINGLNAIEPKFLSRNEFIPPIVFTGLEYYNQESKGTAIEIDDFSGQQPLELSYKENIIRIKFAALNFIQPEKNQYQYKLKGFSDQWFKLKNTHEVVFTNLAAKKYTLYVKAANNDGVWNEEPLSLSLTIKPPITKTTGAFIIYALLFVGVSVGLYQFILSRRLRISENRQLQEVDRLKTKFFTNIAHDFKSPLTVILSTIKNLPTDNRTRVLVERSSKSLLDLINQMLELRKLESNKLKLRLIHANVMECIHYIFEDFQEIAQEQGIALHLISSEQQLMIDFDEEKLTRVVSNLLSNAIKYSKEKGHVYLLLDQVKKADQSYLSIRVKDTGIGIAQQDLDQIFNRFYQINPTEVEGVKSGSGVGLALTKELIQFIGGTIQVKSKLGEGSEFIVLLPIKNQVGPSISDSTLSVLPSATLKLQEDNLEGTLAVGMDKNRLLIIEDHEDISEVLIQLLQPYYTLELAPDGEAGIALAQANIPDLIISDVMMPKKDGFDVLSTLKEDEKTLHIPIVLLTAKSGLDSRIKGLQRGADAYISKPFSNTELLAQIENLLANRAQLQHFYRQGLTQEFSTHKKVEEDPFVARAKAILLQNIADEDFRIPQLIKTMGVSRTQLHNKLKAVTGASTSHFINTIRLSKGRELLLNSNLTIAEVAYAVGFKDPNYFSGRYKDLYNQTPSETRK